MIHYLSTRGQAGRRSFEDVLLAGLAEDGGLFVPESWPSFSAQELRAMRGLDYPALAARLLAGFTTGCFTEEQLLRLARQAYTPFDHAATAPLRHLAGDGWLLELFHGPTLAFKDFAMQLLAAMFDDVLDRRGQRLTIVGATSGDTGAAAVHAFAGKRQVRVAMLHPEGRVSPVQRRQMTTVQADNVLNLAIRGNFDDCQDLVKAMFNDVPFRQRADAVGGELDQLGPGRGPGGLLIWAGLRLGAPDRPIAFAIPTGNFGNVYAGRVAAALGLPIEKLIVATNENDILARFLATGRYERGTVVATTSPSMDIQIASNFERLLLELEGGRCRPDPRPHAGLRAERRVHAGRAGAGTCSRAAAPTRARWPRTIAATLRATGELVDPHTGVWHWRWPGVTDLPPGVPMVTLATAHPAKFPDAVEAATGIRPALPDRLRRPDDPAGALRGHATTIWRAVEAAVRATFGAA